MKTQPNGQPANLSQLKKALSVGTFFEIIHNGSDAELRRVVKAGTNEIVSIVPFDADNRINKYGGSYMHFSKSSYWSFESGVCSVYYSETAHDEANRIFSVRILAYDEEREQRHQEWAEMVSCKKEQEEHDKSERIKAEAERKNEQEYNEKVAPVLKVMIEGGIVDVHTNVVIYAADGASKERNVVLYIADMYGIEIPVKTQGWIKKGLAKIKYDTESKALTTWRFKECGKSNAVYDYLFKVIRAVNDTEEFFTGKKTA